MYNFDDMYFNVQDINCYCNTTVELLLIAYQFLSYCVVVQLNIFSI